MTAAIEILHFEDEPHRIPYPSMLEAALQRAFKKAHLSLTTSRDLCENSIEIKLNSQHVRISYTIYAKTSRQAISATRFRDAILNIIDWSVDNDIEAGFARCKELKGLKIADSRIWVMTGYADLAGRQIMGVSPNHMIRIHTKPLRHSTIVDEIVNMIEPQLKEALKCSAE